MNTGHTKVDDKLTLANMSDKQTRSKTRSVNSMDDTLTDKQVTAPDIAKDDEFVAFIRSALTCLNEKMDSFITNQANLERQLKATDERVTAQATVIINISEINFNANNINRQQQSIDAMEKHWQRLHGTRNTLQRLSLNWKTD